MSVEFTFFPTAVYYMNLAYYNGVVPTFTGISATMWQDIRTRPIRRSAPTLSNDGEAILCNGSRRVTPDDGNWYYTETSSASSSPLAGRPWSKRPEPTLAGQHRGSDDIRGVLQRRLTSHDRPRPQRGTTRPAHRLPASIRPTRTRCSTRAGQPGRDAETGEALMRGRHRHRPRRDPRRAVVPASPAMTRHRSRR